MAREGKTTFPLRLPDELHDRLIKRAGEEGKNKTEVVITALERYLDIQGPKVDIQAGYPRSESGYPRLELAGDSSAYLDIQPGYPPATKPDANWERAEQLLQEKRARRVGFYLDEEEAGAVRVGLPSPVASYLAPPTSHLAPTPNAPPSSAKEEPPVKRLTSKDISTLPPLPDCRICKNSRVTLAEEAGLITAGRCGCAVDCPRCDGEEGYYYEDETNGYSYAGDCRCKNASVRATLLTAAKIPARFLGALRYRGPHHKASPKQRESWQEVERWARTTERGGAGLILSGSPGTGKTVLAVRALGYFVKRSFSIRYVDWPSYARARKELISTYQREEVEEGLPVPRELQDADVLLLDDIAQRPLSKWEQDELHRIVGGRWNAGQNSRVTLLTTNAPLGTRQGEVALADRMLPQTWSRLKQMCRCQALSGPDLRNTAE